MLAILSPTKNIDITNMPMIKGTTPHFINQANEIARQIKKLSLQELTSLLKVNSSLAVLNFNRYQNWQDKPDHNISHPAILTYSGEAFKGINATSFTPELLNLANEKIRILSGLYGLLLPLDLIQPYRLEIGTSWKPLNHRSLYHYWSDMVTKELNRQIEESEGDLELINLASQEYYKVIDQKSFKHPIINIDFKQDENDSLRNITIYTKRARGLMARFITENKIGKTEDIKAFNMEGYYFCNHRSDSKNWLFIRNSIS